MATEQGHHEESGALPRLLAAWVACVCRRPWLVLAVSLLGVGLSLYFTCSYLQYQTQRNDLISPHKDYYKRWQQYVAEFGDDEDMVVVVRGQDREEMKAALEEVASAIQRQPERFTGLFYKVDLRPLHNRALLFLPSEQIQQIQESLQNMSLLLDAPILGPLDPLFTWKSVSLQQLMLEAERRLVTLHPEGEEAAGSLQVLEQLGRICRGASRFLDDPAGYRNPWKSILHQPPGQQDMLAQAQYFFSGDGTLVFLLAHPIREDSFTGARKSVTALRAILDQVRRHYARLEFGLTGLPVLETDEMVASEQDSNTASWLALIGVAVLYLVVYRSWRYPLFTVATLLVGTAWSMGWLTLTVGHLNILSASFAVMLIGMGDYGVLWVTRYGQERTAGADLVTAMRITASSVGPGILTAGMTTALAFFATMLADFKAVVELGWIAGCGVLLCALACFIVLPALLTLWDGRVRKKAVADARVISLEQVKSDRREWLPRLLGRPGWVIGVCCTLALALAYYATSARYDHNLLHMQARGLDSVKWEETLIDRTAGASWHALSYTTTPEEALALKARFEQLPDVSRVVEAASLVPRDQEHKLQQLKDIQFRLRRLPKRGVPIPHAVPSTENLKRMTTRLYEGLARFETGAGVSYPVIKELQRHLKSLQAKLSACPPANAGQRLKQFEEAMTADLVEDLHRLSDVSTPARITVADLPAAFRERYISKTGKWLVCVFAKNSLWEFDALKHFINQVQTVDPEATGKPFTTLEGLRAMKNGFLMAALYASIAMILVLLVDFRSLKYTLLALAPLVMGIVATLGLMTMFGISFNPANMIAVPLILGVGADNGVHVLHDYRSRRRGIYNLSRATGQGIMVAALTTILGFGTLMISNHRGIKSLGLALSLGVTCCMLTALVFLPALLRLKSLRRAEQSTGEDTSPRRAA
jgi:hopanoid biosynthesis associated RND transporter like protein HpnN